jgi:hypothetical protein
MDQMMALKLLKGYPNTVVTSLAEKKWKIGAMNRGMVC